MPITTGFVQTADGYPQNMEDGGAIIGPFQELATVQMTVSDATVAAQIAKKKNQDNSLHWDNFEATFAPGENGYSGEVFGIRLRSYVPGVAATVALNAYFVDDPVPFSNPQPLDGTIDPDGHFHPVVGSGIQFDTEPQSGGFLDAETTGDDGSGNGIKFIAANRVNIQSTGADIELTADTELGLVGGGDVTLESSGAAIGITAQTDIIEQAEDNWSATAATGTAEIEGETGASVTTASGNAVLASTSGDTIIKRGSGGSLVQLELSAADLKATVPHGTGWEVGDSGAAPEFAVLGQTPAIRQATPVLLSDVIAVLQTFGFVN